MATIDNDLEREDVLPPENWLEHYVADRTTTAEMMNDFFLGACIANTPSNLTGEEQAWSFLRPISVFFAN